MRKESIIEEIRDRVVASRGSSGKQYSSWTIGITNDPQRRKREHASEGKKVKYWEDWEANSESDARYIEKYFLDRGMDGGSGGGENPTYVYIF